MAVYPALFQMSLLQKLGTQLQNIRLSAVNLCGDMIATRDFHTSFTHGHLPKIARLTVVDDSEMGRQAKLAHKPPKIIGIWGDETRRGPYKYAKLGTKVTVAVNGEVKWGYIVGCKAQQRPLVPKYDSNNVVLIEKNGTPMGKRVLVPIPSCLRRKADGEFSKIIAISSKFY